MQSLFLRVDEMKIIQRVSDYAESIHQLDFYDEGQHDAPTFETCTATICKGFADALVLTTDAIYHAPTPETPTLAPYARRMVATIEAKKRDEREGKL